MKKGFTLIELLAVIIVLSVLALIAYPIVSDVIDNSEESANHTSLRNYAKGIQTEVYNYQTATGKEPTSVSDLNVEMNADRIVCESVTLPLSGNKLELRNCRINNSEKLYCYVNGDVEDC